MTTPQDPMTDDLRPILDAFRDTLAQLGLAAELPARYLVDQESGTVFELPATRPAEVTVREDRDGDVERPHDDELPGMWENADLIGGETDYLPDL